MEPLDDMWWCNKKHKFKNELDVYSMYVTIPFFLHKMLASHRQPTFRDSRWTNYSNPGQLYPPRPPNFKVVVFFQGLRRVDKTNQTPQHDISRTHSLTLTFGEGGVFQSFPRGLNILSIYGIIVLAFNLHALGVFGATCTGSASPESQRREIETNLSKSRVWRVKPRGCGTRRDAWPCTCRPWDVKRDSQS